MQGSKERERGEEEKGKGRGGIERREREKRKERKVREEKERMEREGKECSIALPSLRSDPGCAAVYANQHVTSSDCVHSYLEQEQQRRLRFTATQTHSGKDGLNQTGPQRETWTITVQPMTNVKLRRNINAQSLVNTHSNTASYNIMHRQHTALTAIFQVNLGQTSDKNQ